MASNPGFKEGEIPTADQWNAAFAVKLDEAALITPLTVSAPWSFDDTVVVTPQASDPTSPPDGTIWSTSTGFYGRVSGITIGPFAPIGGVYPTSVGPAMRFLRGQLIQTAVYDASTGTYGQILLANGKLEYASSLNAIGPAANGLNSTADGGLQFGTVIGRMPIPGPDGAKVADLSAYAQRYFKGVLLSQAALDANGFTTVWSQANGVAQASISPTLVEACDGGSYQYTISQDGLWGQLFQTPNGTGVSTRITNSGPNYNLNRSADGTFITYVRNGKTYWQTIPSDGTEHRLLPNTNLLMVGDSLSKYGGTGFGAAVGVIYPTRTKIDQGIGTQRTEHFAFRFGATNINGATILYNVTGGSIPASGPVNVTPDTVDLFYAWNTSLGSFHCLLAGVSGIISYNIGSGLQTFTRDTPGSIVAAGSPVTIQVTSGFAANLTCVGAPTFPGLHEMTTLLLVGYNDLHGFLPGSGGFVYSEPNALANIAAGVAMLSSKAKRVIVGLPPQSALQLTLATCGLIDALPGGPYGFTGQGIAANNTQTLNWLNAAVSLRAALVSTYEFTVDFMSIFKNAGHTVTYNIGGTDWDFITPLYNNGGVDPTHWEILDTSQALAASGYSTIINANGW